MAKFGKKKMTKEIYFCSNESLTNIRKYCSSISQMDMFSIIINQETVSVPVEVAIAISSTITNSLVNDPTLREMHFQIKFRDNESINIIKNILNGNVLSKDIFENKSTFYDTLIPLQLATLHRPRKYRHHIR